MPLGFLFLLLVCSFLLFVCPEDLLWGGFLKTFVSRGVNSLSEEGTSSCAEMEVDEARADRVLRETGGDAVAALKVLVNA